MECGFQIQNIYNAAGYLCAVKKGAGNTVICNSTNALWLANTEDPDQRITNATLGNGLTTERSFDPTTRLLLNVQTGTVQNQTYTYDLLGDVLSRQDSINSVSETLTYDALNRLTTVMGPASKTYQYDALGNITNKSDIGAYTYGGAAGPHAVTQVTGLVNNSYTYDANGNMITGAGRAISYTSFNKPAQINTGTDLTTFTYDPNDTRLVKTTSANTTVYIGKLYERATSGSLIEHKHYIYANGELIALHTERNDASQDTRYLHSDHLGSLVAITDESGNRVESLSYDPYGNRRQANGQDATTPIVSLTHFGYTSQEHDDNVKLINMNARLYDPILGRFITPDSTVQNPGNGQTYNRYSYAGNNPMRYVDPTGHDDEAGNGTGGNGNFQDPFNGSGPLSSFAGTGAPDFSFNQFSNGNGNFQDPFNSGGPLSSFAGTGTPDSSWTGIPMSLDPLKMLGNFGLGTVEAAANLIGGFALPGFPDYVPFLQNYRFKYDNPTVSQNLEFAFGLALGGRGGASTPAARMALARELGDAGEAMSGITGPKVRIPSLTGTANYRVPDYFS